jgi:processive 1,2-diacylglycerol beta-glucosyltransferase
MKYRVLVLYEYGEPGLPFGGSYVRLLSPLSYPTIMEVCHVYPLPVDPGDNYDVAIIDRSWRPDITPGLAEQTVTSLRQRGVRVIHHLDDYLLDLPNKDLPRQNYQEAVKIFVEQADLVMTSTLPLAERLRDLNRKVVIVPNALDDRLLPAYPTGTHHGNRERNRPLVLGYMGTHTHDDDLSILLPALAELAKSSPVPLLLQIVGGVAQESTVHALQALPLPVQFIHPPVEQYPLFINWFWQALSWDIALGPLLDTPFNRCKSDLKYLDYAALGVPGIYSDLPVYASVIHGVTGLRVANQPDAWIDGLRQLITQPALRRTLAANAYAYLRQDRTLSTQIGHWLALLETVNYG